MDIFVVAQVTIDVHCKYDINKFESIAGYRPILDAMKSFATETEYPVLVDIEV